MRTLGRAHAACAGAFRADNVREDAPHLEATADPFQGQRPWPPRASGVQGQNNWCSGHPVLHFKCLGAGSSVPAAVFRPFSPPASSSTRLASVFVRQLPHPSRSNSESAQQHASLHLGGARACRTWLRHHVAWHHARRRAHLPRPRPQPARSRVHNAPDRRLFVVRNAHRDRGHGRRKRAGHRRHPVLPLSRARTTRADRAHPPADRVPASAESRACPGGAQARRGQGKGPGR